MLHSTARQSLTRHLIRRRHALDHLSASASSLLVTEHSKLLTETMSTIETRRHFSDKLMGFSPMAPSIPSQPSSPTGETGKIPTAQDVTTSGGVWAPTSAKRDKLTELKIALEVDQETLDDAATPEQLQDLYLADGIQLIAKTSDSIPDADTKEIQEFSEWLVEQQGNMPENVDQTELEGHLTLMSEKLSNLASHFPAPRYLRDTRDFFDPSEAAEDELAKLSDSDLGLQDDAFQKAVIRFRLLLTQSACEHLKASWTVLSTVSDGDVDRAAVKGEAVEPAVKAVSLSKVYKFLFAHTSGTCSDRVDAAWELLDRDNDGLLDESEMNNAALLCLAPMQGALGSIFQEALDARPVRDTMPDIGDEIGDEQVVPAPKGWRQRRKEAKAKKTLLRSFQKACKNHFLDEVEINHRFRCIYAWAEKADQDNKLDSVLVDSGWSGRKRYVELSPKISLPEFREVQQVHFTHLDRIGTEILKSFREDIWVLQGKGRQNRELMRDCLGFLAVVSVLDFLILLS